MENKSMMYDPLIEISRHATIEASKALSKFVNVPVSLGTIHAELRKEITIALEFDPPEPVYTISSSIVGDATGLAALCMPLRTACGLCDLLFKRELGGTQSIRPEEEDALLEVGNIVIGNYLRSFVRAMPDATLVHRAARLLCDTSANMTTRLYEVWKLEGLHDAMVFEVTFNFRHASLAGSVIILLGAEAIGRLLDKTLTV